MPEEPSTVLRGARVEVDPRLVAQVVCALVVAGLLVTAVILFVAGAHHNTQIGDLQRNGLAVRVTSTGCMGMLGGSGSNAAGYNCQGTYAVGGHRYHATLPGNGLHPPGSTVELVTAADDPTLLSTRAALDSERVSAGVFVVPSVLAGAGLVLAGGWWWRLRAQRRGRRPEGLPGGDDLGAEGGV